MRQSTHLSGLSKKWRMSADQPGSRGEFHPPAPTDPDVSLSAKCRIRHLAEYAEDRIMPSRWLLRLVKQLAGGWFFGII